MNKSNPIKNNIINNKKKTITMKIYNSKLICYNKKYKN